jgi:glycosyltransferase involved in cell wall biosynthesis
MPDSQLISVVIGTRNRRALLLRTLGTVLGQTHRDIEVVVVDEASDDGTAEAVAALGDARVRVVRNAEPQGVGRARNRGITESSGTYVAITDDDDLWAPDKLERQLLALRSTRGALWSFVGAMVIDPELRMLRWQRVPAVDGLANRLLEVNVVPGGASGVVARRDAIDTAGGFDGAYRHFADWDLWIRLALLGPAAPVVAALLGYTRHRGASQVAPGKYDDLAYIEEKFRDERARRGVEWTDVHVLHWIAETSLRAGDTAAARAALQRAAREPLSRHSRLRGALTYVPGYLAAYDLSKRMAIPKQHKRAAAAWLSRVGA